MSPELFAGTSAEDEWHPWRELGEVARRGRLKVHRDSYITDRDFAYLARRGIDFVRIPVPLFTSSPGAVGLSATARRDHYRTVAEAHVDAPERDVWDMGKAMELGVLPHDLSGAPMDAAD